MNNAWLSRARYTTTALEKDDILLALKQAIECSDNGLGQSAALFKDNVLDRLAELVQGDVRMSLNYLELFIMGKKMPKATKSSR